MPESMQALIEAGTMEHQPKSMKALINANLMKPGERRCLVKTGRGRKASLVYAELTVDGCLRYLDESNEWKEDSSPSPFALYAKRKENKGRESENGWKCVLYEDDKGNRRSLNDLWEPKNPKRKGPSEKKGRSEKHDDRSGKKRRTGTSTPATVSRPMAPPVQSEEQRKSAPNEVQKAAEFVYEYFKSEKNFDPAFLADKAFEKDREIIRTLAVKRLQTLLDHSKKELDEWLVSADSNEYEEASRVPGIPKRKKYRWERSDFSKKCMKEQLNNCAKKFKILPDGCAGPTPDGTMYLLRNSMSFNEGSWKAYQHALGKKKSNRKLL